MLRVARPGGNDVRQLVAVEVTDHHVFGRHAIVEDGFAFERTLAMDGVDRQAWLRGAAAPV